MTRIQGEGPFSPEFDTTMAAPGTSFVLSDYGCFGVCQYRITSATGAIIGSVIC